MEKSTSNVEVLEDFVWPMKELYPKFENDYAYSISDKIMQQELYKLKKRQRVLILTHHRSGSSFTGEIFNLHPDAFYMYEPLRIATDHGCTSENELQRKEVFVEFIQASAIAFWNFVKFYLTFIENSETIAEA